MDSAEGESLPLRRVVEAFVDYRGATPEKAEDGIPLVTATNVKDGEIDFSLGAQFLTQEKYVEWMRRGFPAVGDVLLTTEAPLGEVAMIGDPRVALAQRIILLKPNRQRIQPEFLYASLRSPRVQADLLSRASGSTVWGIRSDRLRDVRLLLPSLADQERVVRVSREVESTYRCARGLLRQQINLLLERRQALITTAVADYVAEAAV
jgi:type I restriction enzyme S subunit